MEFIPMAKSRYPLEAVPYIQPDAERCEWIKLFAANIRTEERPEALLTATWWELAQALCLAGYNPDEAALFMGGLLESASSNSGFMLTNHFLTQLSRETVVPVDHPESAVYDVAGFVDGFVAIEATHVGLPAHLDPEGKFPYKGVRDVRVRRQTGKAPRPERTDQGP
jgi:hypothetical protein